MNLSNELSDELDNEKNSFNKILGGTLFAILIAAGIFAPHRIKESKQYSEKVGSYSHMKSLVVNDLPEDPDSKFSTLGFIHKDIAQQYCPEDIKIADYKSLMHVSGDTIQFPVYPEYSN